MRNCIFIPRKKGAPIKIKKINPYVRLTIPRKTKEMIKEPQKMIVDITTDEDHPPSITEVFNDLKIEGDQLKAEKRTLQQEPSRVRW